MFEAWELATMFDLPSLDDVQPLIDACSQGVRDKHGKPLVPIKSLMKVLRNNLHPDL